MYIIKIVIYNAYNEEILNIIYNKYERKYKIQ